MAENEYLDLNISRRWQRVLRAWQENRPIAEFCALNEQCLIDQIKAWSKPKYSGGPPQMLFKRLLDVWDNGPEIKRIVRESQGHDLALVFQREVFGATNREEAAERCLSGIMNTIFDQIAIKTVRPDGGQTFGQVSSGFKQVQSHMALAIRGLGEKWKWAQMMGLAVA